MALAADPVTAVKLLKVAAVQRVLRDLKVSIGRIDHITVDAEETQADGARRDVVVRSFAAVAASSRC